MIFENKRYSESSRYIRGIECRMNSCKRCTDKKYGEYADEN